jgi:GT2 family glycosyltransferase
MISVIVPVFNEYDMTLDCIEAIRENTQDCEIIIIDNGSDPAFKAPFTGFIDISVIRNEKNEGFPVAVNQGIRAAKGDIVILLNNDVTVTPGWAERLIKPLSRPVIETTQPGDEYVSYEYDGDAPFSIVGPIANYSAGMQRVEVEDYGNKDELCEASKNWAEEHDGEIQEVNYVIGFCMAFRKTLFDELGEFDESLWPCSGEEIDFCFRARQKGHKVGIVVDCYVHHEGSKTFKGMHDAGTVDYVDICKRNDAHLAEKWGDYWNNQAVNKRQYPYVIVAPPYHDHSAGVRVLHELKRHLQERGFEAITTWDMDATAPTDAIVVYPEVVSGNPLKGRTVVRYILNHPGLLGGDKEYDESEILFACNEEHLRRYVPSDDRILCVPVIEEFFRDEGLPRKGGCFYVGKGADLVDKFPKLNGMTEIKNMTRQEVAYILKTSELLYTYDNFSMIIEEAKKCGCPVKVMGEEIYKVGYDDHIKDFESQLDNFINITQAAATENRIHLAIGVPLTFPYVPSSFFHSFALMEKPDFIYIHADNGSIHDLRNNIVEKAINEGCTHLIMMDTDQVYHPDTIPRLLSHNLPVVGALVHRRYPPFDSLMLKHSVVGERTNRYDSIDEWEEGELVEVDATGGGCLMFNMEVFKKIPHPWFRADKKGVGEDIGFCQDLKAAGYRIFVDTSVPAGHLTTMIVNTATNRLYRAMKDKQRQRALKKALTGEEAA